MAIVKLNQDFAFNIKDMLTHTSILGASGTGKTTTLKKIINTIHDTKNVLQIVLDNKGDLMDSFEGESIKKYNLMDIKKGTIEIKIPISSIPLEKLGELLELSDNAINILLKVFDKSINKKLDYDYKDHSNFKHLHGTIDDFNHNYKDSSSMFDKKSMNVLLTKIETAKMKYDKYMAYYKCKILGDFNTYTDKLLIINTQGMDSTIYKILNLYLTQKVIEDYKDEHKDTRCLLYIDEAHNAFDKISDSALKNYEKITKEYRSKGVGLVLITQHLSHIPETILENINNLIQHGINNVINDKAINSVSKMFATINANHPETRREGVKPTTFKGRIMNLAVGECFARFAGSPVTQIKVEI